MKKLILLLSVIALSSCNEPENTKEDKYKSSYDSLLILMDQENNKYRYYKKQFDYFINNDLDSAKLFLDSMKINNKKRQKILDDMKILSKNYFK